MAMQQWFCSKILPMLCCHLQNLTGEGLDCPDYADFPETTLKPLLQEYKPNNKYNADETSLLYKALANRMYAFSAETVRG